MDIHFSKQRSIPAFIWLACSLAFFSTACTGDDNGGSDTDTVIDDPTDAGEYVGLWQFQSFTVDGKTYTRDGNPAVRGDARFTSGSSSKGELDVRLIITEDGVLTDADIQTITIGCDIEKGRWIFDEDGTIRVMNIEIDADTVAFTWDETAKENKVDPDGPGGPSAMVLKRATEVPSILVGDWELVSVDISDNVMKGGACRENFDGDAWQILTAELNISDRLILEETMVETNYSDAKCTQKIDSQETLIQGYIEEREGEADIWFIFDKEPGEFITLELEEDGDNLIWNHKSCLPKPDCGDGFTKAVIRPKNP